MLSVKIRLTNAISLNQAKFGDDTEKHVSDDAKKAFAETTQLLENVSEQSSKSLPTNETLKMRKKVHQVKEGREVREKLQELIKDNGKDDTELRDFAANRLYAAAQMQQDTETIETAQLGAPQRRAVVDAKVEKVAKRGLAKPYEFIVERQVGKPDVWNFDKIAHQ